MVDHRALFDRSMEIHSRREWDRLAEVFTEDIVEEYPQSGEVFRGLDNVRAVRTDYPNLDTIIQSVDPGTVRVAASEQKWVVTQMYTAVRLEGSGDIGTGISRIHYPDGSTWWQILIYELRDGRIAHASVYWAPEFEPPEWRAPYRAARP